METQGSILPLLIRKEMQQIIVFRNHFQELITKTTEQEMVTLPMTHSLYNPNSKALSGFLDNFCKTDKT